MGQEILNHPMPTFNLPIITASPPLPPNWMQHFQNTITSLVPYKLFPVEPTTSEYQTIVDLFGSLNIISVEQIVNPMLWLRFLNARKEMIRSKSADLELLSQLMLSEQEVMASYYYSMNFDIDANIADVPYNENMALLFHCTRNSANIEAILTHGLDDRMCNKRGLLGRGIYFADNPKKSMNYDGCKGIMFLFAVLLGDCLYLDKPLEPTMSYRVKEPEKWPTQKRNVIDSSFDSIISRPLRMDNEYVIYNRYQCYPLYKVNYDRKSSNPFTYNVCYDEARLNLPFFSWQLTGENIPMPNRLIAQSWPFYAKEIFAMMEDRKEKIGLTFFQTEMEDEK